MTEQPTIVLDASALLALLREEPGADEVERVLDGSMMSCVNLSEVLQKAEQHAVDVEGLEHDLEALGVRFAPYDTPAARSSGGALELRSRSLCSATEPVSDSPRRSTASHSPPTTAGPAPGSAWTSS